METKQPTFPIPQMPLLDLDKMAENMKLAREVQYRRQFLGTPPPRFRDADEARDFFEQR